MAIKIAIVLKARPFLPSGHSSRAITSAIMKSIMNIRMFPGGSFQVFIGQGSSIDRDSLTNGMGEVEPDELMNGLALSWTLYNFR